MHIIAIIYNHYYNNDNYYNDNYNNTISYDRI